MQKQFRTEVQTDQEGLENLPDVAVFTLDEHAAQEIIRLSQQVSAEGLYKIERFDHRVRFVNQQHLWRDEAGDEGGVQDGRAHAQDMARLAIIANARSSSRADEDYFADASLIERAPDGWLSLTSVGMCQLQDAGYHFDPKQGWQAIAPTAPSTDLADDSDEPFESPVSSEVECLNVTSGDFWYSASYKNSGQEFRSERISIAELAHTFGLEVADEPDHDMSGMAGVSSEEMKVYTFDNNDLLLAAVITITNAGHNGAVVIVQPGEGKSPSIAANLSPAVEAALKDAHPTWGYIQEGGSSSEMYMHWFDTPELAKAGRIECAQAAYRTSEIFEISASMTALGDQAAELCRVAAMGAISANYPDDYPDDETDDLDDPEHIEAVEITPELTKRVAGEFIAVLRERLTPHELALANARNQGDVLKGQVGVCHTHDFIDANEAMAEGFVRAGVVKSSEMAAHEAYADLWNDAWTLARESKFAAPALAPMSNKPGLNTSPAASAGKSEPKP